MRKYKNKILKAWAYINFTIFLVAACAIDSESWIPTYICIITGAWLSLFAYANNWFDDYVD